MESEAKYALVGAVTIFVSALLLLFVLWLSGEGKGASQSFYIIYFHNYSLEGLQQDSTVTMRGIKVGKVKEVEISSKNIEQIRVLISLDADTPVKVDSQAVIKRNLLTGLANIDLINTSQASARLLATPPHEEFPVIPEGKTDLQTIADSLPVLVEKVATIVDRVENFLGDENQKAFTAMLGDAQRFTHALGDNDKLIVSTIEEAKLTAAELRGLTKSLRELTDDSSPKIKQVSEDLSAALENIRQLSESLNVRMTEMAGSITGGASVITQEIGALAQDLSRAADSIAAAAEKFEEPQTIILGPSGKALGPGESLPLKD